MISSASSLGAIQTEVAGHRIAELVEHFGTPLCVYDFALVLDRIRSLSAFDAVRFSPASSIPTAVWNHLRSEGVSLSVSNAIEIRRGLAAGFSTQPIRADTKVPGMVYAGDLMDRESLDLVTELGLHAICGSPEMIDQIGQRRPGSDVTLSVNPFFANPSETGERFITRDALSGIGPNQVEECLFKADQYGIMVTGLQLQLRHDIESQALEQACQVLLATVSTIGRTVSTIGISGAVPWSDASTQSSPMITEIQKALNATRHRIHESVDHAIQFEITVGETIFSDSRNLIAEVRAVKKLGDRRCYVVDGEVNDFLPVAKSVNEGLVAICPRDGATHERPFVDAFLCGPFNPFQQKSCTPKLKHQRLPIAVVGDFVVVQDSIDGTDSKTTSHDIRRRTEIILKNGVVDLLRGREAYDD